MTALFRNVFSSPRVWGAAALAAFIASAVLFYADQQDTAERMFARREGPPPRVAIEDFDPLRHSNGIGEVRLVGVLGVETPRLVTFHEAGRYRSLILFPLHALNGTGEAPLAHVLVDAAELGDPTPARVPGTVEIHPTDDGPVVEVNGLRVRVGTSFSEPLKDALAALMGRETAPIVVRPFTTDRQVALAPRPASTLAVTFAWIGLACLLATAATMSRPGRAARPSAHARTAPRLSPPSTRQSHRPITRSVFEPIATQDEIFRSDAARQRAISGRRITEIPFAQFVRSPR